MANFVNDYKTFSMIEWPTYEEEYRNNLIFKFRTLNHVNPAPGDTIEFTSKTHSIYVIEEIITEQPSKAWDNMKIITARFKKQY